MVEKLKDIIIYNYSMPVMEKFRNYRKMVAMMLGWIIYVRIMMRLNVNLMEMSIRNPKSIIMISMLPATKKCY